MGVNNGWNPATPATLLNILSQGRLIPGCTCGENQDF